MAGLPQGWIRDGGQSSTVDHSAAKKYLLEGTSLLRARRFPEAEKSLRESLRLRPDDPEVLNNLGTTVWEQGRAAEATAYYLRGLPVPTAGLWDPEQPRHRPLGSRPSRTRCRVLSPGARASARLA